MLSRIIVLVIAGVAVVYIVRFIDNFISAQKKILNKIIQIGRSLSKTSPYVQSHPLRYNISMYL